MILSCLQSHQMLGLPAAEALNIRQQDRKQSSVLLPLLLHLGLYEFFHHQPSAAASGSTVQWQPQAGSHTAPPSSHHHNHQPPPSPPRKAAAAAVAKPHADVQPHPNTVALLPTKPPAEGVGLENVVDTPHKTTGPAGLTSQPGERGVGGSSNMSGVGSSTVRSAVLSALRPLDPSGPHSIMGTAMSDSAESAVQSALRSKDPTVTMRSPGDAAMGALQGLKVPNLYEIMARKAAGDDA